MIGLYGGYLYTVTTTRCHHAPKAVWISPLSRPSTSTSILTAMMVRQAGRNMALCVRSPSNGEALCSVIRMALTLAGDLIAYVAGSEMRAGLGNYVVGTGLSGGSIPSKCRSRRPAGAPDIRWNLGPAKLLGQSYPIDTFETVADSPRRADDVILTVAARNIILAGPGGGT